MLRLLYKLSSSHHVVAQSCPTFCNPMVCQAPLSMGFSRQKYWSGLPVPSPGDLSSQPRDRTLVSHIAIRFSTIQATRDYSGCLLSIHYLLPWWLSGKESACQSRRHWFDLWVQKIPGEGNGNLLHYSCLASRSKKEARVSRRDIHGLMDGQLIYLKQGPGTFIYSTVCGRWLAGQGGDLYSWGVGVWRLPHGELTSGWLISYQLAEGHPSPVL